MTIQKKKDTDLLKWVILSALFVLSLSAVDIWYSSFSEMNTAIKCIVVAGHLILSILLIGSFIKFNDPEYDYLKKSVLWCVVLLIIFIGIHHATSREDKQVIIDSHENAIKDSAK